MKRILEVKGKLIDDKVQFTAAARDNPPVQFDFFPPIGTGLYQVPLDLCARVMVDTITDHLRNDTSLEEVLLVVVDTREYEPFRRVMEEGA